MGDWACEKMYEKGERVCEKVCVKMCEKVASSGWTEGMIVGWTEA